MKMWNVGVVVWFAVEIFQFLVDKLLLLKVCICVRMYSLIALYIYLYHLLCS